MTQLTPQATSPAPRAVHIYRSDHGTRRHSVPEGASPPVVLQPHRTEAQCEDCAIPPALFAALGLEALNGMRLASPRSAILSAMIVHALIIPPLEPPPLRGVAFSPLNADQPLRRHRLIYGAAGVIAPFAGIQLIDHSLTALGLP
jgi:hypothetical protein